MAYIYICVYVAVLSCFVHVISFVCFGCMQHSVVLQLHFAFVREALLFVQVAHHMKSVFDERNIHAYFFYTSIPEPL